MIKIGSRFVRNSHELMHLKQECGRFAQEHRKELHKSQLEKLENFLKLENQVYEFETINYLVKFLSDKNQKINSRKLNREEVKKMEAARHFKNIHRLGRIFEKADKQIADRVRGINNLPSDELLPLDHHYTNQHQRWIKNGKGRYVHLKPIGESNETKVSAFGDPEDPSMVYWRNENKAAVARDSRESGRQLGHRYRAVAKKNHSKGTLEEMGSDPDSDIYSYNHAPEKARHYGAKKDRFGKYKVIDYVDGHSQQAQTDPVNLDNDEKDYYPTADRHPHSMYWEYKIFGQFFRQDFFEQYTLDSVKKFDDPISLLQVNDYGNYDRPNLLDTGGKKNSNAPQKAIVAKKFHVKMKRDGVIKYWESPNRPDKRYGDLGIKSKVRPKEPKSVGVGRRLEVEDVDAFPSAQVIELETLDHEDFTGSKSDVRDYESPPSTPNYLSPIRAVRRLHDQRVHFEGEELTPEEDTDSEVKSSFITSMTRRDKEIRSLVNEKNIEWESKSDHPLGRRRSISKHRAREESTVRSPPKEERSRRSSVVAPRRDASQRHRAREESTERSPPKEERSRRSSVVAPRRDTSQRHRAREESTERSPPREERSRKSSVVAPRRDTSQRHRAREESTERSPPREERSRRSSMVTPRREISRHPERVASPAKSSPREERSRRRGSVVAPRRETSQGRRAKEESTERSPPRGERSRRGSVVAPIREASQGCRAKEESTVRTRSSSLEHSVSEEKSNNSQDAESSSGDESNNNNPISSVKNAHNKSGYHAYNNPNGMFHHQKEATTREPHKFKNNKSSSGVKKPYGK